MNFFVIGLPRSRTCWLANFLTYDGHFCYHEGINGCRSLEEYKGKLGNSNGDASTALMLFDVNRIFPDSPKVIIERDPKYAIEFQRKYLGIDNPDGIYVLKELLDEVEGLRIQFEEIDENLPRIWKYIFGTDCDKQRLDLLTTMNIQTKLLKQYDESALTELLSGVEK